jgi:hypothetical protein
VPNKEAEASVTFGTSGTCAGAGVGARTGGDAPKDPGGVVTAKGLVYAAVLVKKLGILEALVERVAVTGASSVRSSDLGGCGVGGTNEMVGSAGAGATEGSGAETGLAAGAVGLDNENGSALMGGSFAPVAS